MSPVTFVERREDRCACGCGLALWPGSASLWFASEACQVRWTTRISKRPEVATVFVAPCGDGGEGWAVQ